MARSESKRGEESTIRGVSGSGDWCMFFLNVMAMFAIVPLLRDHLGGFWSFAAFLPIWAIVYILIHVIEFRREDPNDR